MTGGCTFKLGGSEYWLVYTADAYFDINDAYGTDFLEKLRAGTRQAYETAVGCLVILAREGELCRRYMGYDAAPMLTEETVRRCALPDAVVPIKIAVNRAVNAGLRIENAKDTSDEPVDVGLLEYEKKTVLG